jgi:uncharacterized membrane protein
MLLVVVPTCSTYYYWSLCGSSLPHKFIVAVTAIIVVAVIVVVIFPVVFANRYRRLLLLGQFCQ